MPFSNTELIENIPKHDLRSVARLITLIENRVPRAREVQAKLFERSGRAHVIGITGSPGAGKSTLVDQLASKLRKDGKRVAVLAVDPTSPFSGGAVLGDRIRMNSACEDSEIFIRSMATRGALGGVSRATLDAVHVLDSAGFDVVIVETVGVGQGEVDIVRLADTCAVILVPGMGDSVQAIKAGILEIADIFVINKADREGADLVHKDLRILLSLSNYEDSDWRPPILKTVATKNEGIEELIKESDNHFSWLASSGQGQNKRIENLRDTIVRIAMDTVVEKLVLDNDKKIDQYAKACFERKTDPFSVVDELLGD